jgi:hypothetical protein
VGTIWKRKKTAARLGVAVDKPMALFPFQRITNEGINKFFCPDGSQRMLVIRTNDFYQGISRPTQLPLGKIQDARMPLAGFGRRNGRRKGVYEKKGERNVPL